MDKGRVRSKLFTGRVYSGGIWFLFDAFMRIFTEYLPYGGRLFVDVFLVLLFVSYHSLHDHYGHWIC